MNPPSSATVATIEGQHRFYIELLGTARGSTVLDAGCGRGRTLALARGSHPELRWTGVDVRRPAVLTGNAELLGAALAVADVRWLPFAANAFDAVFSRDVLECVPEPREALLEMTRALKPGGTLVVCHWDWDTEVFSIPDRDLCRRMVSAFAETQQGWMEHFDPAMGRRLYGLVKSCPGLEIVDHGVLVLVETEYAAGRQGHDQARAMATLLPSRGKVSAEDAARFLALLSESQDDGTYFYSANHYWVRARRGI